jgi:hypothetical protein
VKCKNFNCHTGRNCVIFLTEYIASNYILADEKEGGNNWKTAVVAYVKEFP